MRKAHSAVGAAEVTFGGREDGGGGRHGQVERRTIGAAALEVGAVGLGCMPMSWAYTRARGSAARSRCAPCTRRWTRASTLLDTADMYGPFTNELLLGRVLKERRPRPSSPPSAGCWWASSTSWPTGAPAMCGGPATPRCGGCRPTSSTCTSCTGPIPRCRSRRPGARWRSWWRAGKVRALGLCAVGARAGSRREGGAAARRERSAQLERVQQVFPVERGAGGAVGVVAGGAGRAAAVVRGARGGVPGGDAAGQRVPHRDAHAGRRASSRTTCGPGIPGSPPR